MTRRHYAIVHIIPDFKPGDPPPSGYIEWHEWAHVQTKARLRQEQCGRCSLWRFPPEMSAVRDVRTRQTPSGAKRHTTTPVCIGCAQRVTA